MSNHQWQSPKCQNWGLNMPANEIPAIVEYYNSFRSALFISSITLGTFLFTMKAFIIQTMKKEVYDKKSYQDSIKSRQREGKKGEKIYGQLDTLRRVLFWAIATSLFNAMIQLSLGYFEAVWSVTICLFTTLISWCFMACALLLVSSNLEKMITLSEPLSEDV